MGMADLWQDQIEALEALTGKDTCSPTPCTSSKGDEPACCADKTRAMKIKYEPRFEGETRTTERSAKLKRSRQALVMTTFKKSSYKKIQTKMAIPNNTPNPNTAHIPFNSAKKSDNTKRQRSQSAESNEKKEKSKPIYNLGEDVCRRSKEQAEKTLTQTHKIKD